MLDNIGFGDNIDFTGMLGELSANSLGFSTRFNGYTPASYFQDSVNRLNSFLSQRGGGIGQNRVFQEPRIRSGADWDRIIRENQTGSNSTDPETSPYIPHYPPTQGDPSLGNAGRVRRICSDAQGNIVDASREGQPGVRCTTSVDQSPGFFEELFNGEFHAPDLFKNIFLAALALILIAAAIFSMR